MGGGDIKHFKVNEMFMLSRLVGDLLHPKAERVPVQCGMALVWHRAAGAAAVALSPMKASTAVPHLLHQQ